MSNPSAEFMAQGPFAIQAFVREQLAEKSLPSPGMNWLGLAESAAFNVHQGSEVAIWSSIAIQIYDWLASNDAEPDHSSFMISGMMARANWLIYAPGSADQDEPRQREILDWFQRSTGMSRSEAADRAARWRELPVVPDLLALRRIKNKLAIVGLMYRYSAAVPDPEIVAWLELRPRLP